ncbi:MAG: DUF4026 domain-containing protein [Myxococcales bacterium]|nr:DUF4026 domain-containing protein [Myxococcales bacterium]MCB9579059.1 DUF4026 domain-containing protein [Polyangiaceae bacterium]
MGTPSSIVDLLQDPPPATLLALLDAGATPPSPEDVLSRLEQLGVQAAEIDDDDAPAFRMIAELGVGPDAVPLSIFLEPAGDPLLSLGVSWRGVLGEDEDAARASRWALGVSQLMAHDPLRAFHALLRVLYAIVPEPTLVVDADSLIPRPGGWLAEVALGETPPSPTHLFSIHQVSEPGGELSWLHTHGLARCGAIELDILDAPSGDAGLLAQMVNAAAGLLIERGVPEAGEPFVVGQDLVLAWLPWDRAISEHTPQGLGGPSDRDSVHAGARGVLFAVEDDGELSSVEQYLPILRENPLLYVSVMETERMALLASERLPRFLSLFRTLGEDPEWMFLVKLGYEVDDPAEDGEREHLWFHVHELSGSEVDATLLNQPYRLERLSEGQRAKHSLALLSDWAILCDKGRFDADSVGELERALARDLALH